MRTGTKIMLLGAFIIINTFFKSALADVLVDTTAAETAYYNESIGAQERITAVAYWSNGVEFTTYSITSTVTGEFTMAFLTTINVSSAIVANSDLKLTAPVGSIDTDWRGIPVHAWYTKVYLEAGVTATLTVRTTADVGSNAANGLYFNF